jgi:hypothetical protein
MVGSTSSGSAGAIDAAPTYPTDLFICPNSIHNLHILVDWQTCRHHGCHHDNHR